MLFACLVCKWPLEMIGVAVLASAIISSPGTIALQVLAWLFQKIDCEKSFAWMLLMAFIPPLAFITAWLFADFVPGKLWLVLLLSTGSGYVGILSHAISVTQFFNPTQYEREENNTIG